MEISPIDSRSRTHKPIKHPHTQLVLKTKTPLRGLTIIPPPWHTEGFRLLSPSQASAIPNCRMPKPQTGDRGRQTTGRGPALGWCPSASSWGDGCALQEGTREEKAWGQGLPSTASDYLSNPTPTPTPGSRALGGRQVSSRREPSLLPSSKDCTQGPSCWSSTRDPGGRGANASFWDRCHCICWAHCQFGNACSCSLTFSAFRAWCQT